MPFKNFLIILFLFVFIIKNGNAQRIYDQYERKGEIIPGLNLTVSDGDTTYSDSTKMVYREALVSLNYVRDELTDLAGGTPWTYEIIFKLYDLNDTTSFVNDTLKIDFNDTLPGIQAMAHFRGQGWHAIGMEVLSVCARYGGGSCLSAPETNPLIPVDIELKLSLIGYSIPFGAYPDGNGGFQFATDYVVVAPTQPIEIDPCTFRTRKFFRWSASPLPVILYELEYIYVDNEWYTDGTGSTKLNQVSGIEHSIWDLATPIRIELPSSQTSWLVPEEYPDGVIYVRVRPVMSSNWLIPGLNSTGNFNHSREVIHPAWGTPLAISLSPFEKQRNWNWEAVYSEDGKHKKVISYHDGLLRPRQTLTNLSTDNVTLVQETMYDYEGRGVVSIMPWPEPCQDLSYKPNRHFDMAGGEFAKQDFELFNGDDRINTTAGASEYYSPLNPFIGTNKFAQFTPQAENYPYSVVEYMQDNTGRVKRQGGVGKIFQPDPSGINHETVYYYSNPTQTELHRLFGLEVGDAKFYTKQIVQDANDQISAVYTDNEGKTVATSLLGASPDNLKALCYNNVETVTHDLMGNQSYNANTGEHLVDTYVFNEVPNNTFDFTYRVTPRQLQAIFGVSPNEETYCKECNYKLYFELAKEDGTIITMELKDVKVGGASLTTPLPFAYVYGNNYNNLEFDLPFSNNSTCEQNLELPLIEVTFEALFPDVGNYRIIKRLSWDKQEMNTWLATLPPVGSAHYNQVTTSLTNYYTSQISTDDCGDTPSSNMTDEELTAQLELGCKSLLTRMKEQVSPGGLYYYDNTGLPPSAPDHFQTSPTIADMWAVIAPKLFDPASNTVPGPNDIILLNSNGTAMTSAVDLKNPANWQDSWADVIVTFHPEYCHYERCLAHIPSQIYSIRQTQFTHMRNDPGPPNGDGAGSVYFNPQHNTHQSLADAVYSIPYNNSMLTDPIYGAAPLLNVSQVDLVMLHQPAGVNSGYLNIWEFSSFANNPNLFPGNSIEEEEWTAFVGRYTAEREGVWNSSTVVQAAGCQYYSSSDPVVTEPPSSQNLSNSIAQNYFGGSIPNPPTPPCSTGCQTNAQLWLGQVLAPCGSFSTMYSQLSDPTCTTTLCSLFQALESHLVAYCISKCGIVNPLGLITSGDWATDSQDPLSPAYDAAQILNGTTFATELANAGFNCGMTTLSSQFVYIVYSQDYSQVPVVNESDLSSVYTYTTYQECNQDVPCHIPSSSEISQFMTDIVTAMNNRASQTQVVNVDLGASIVDHCFPTSLQIVSNENLISGCFQHLQACTSSGCDPCEAGSTSCCGWTISVDGGYTLADITSIGTLHSNAYSGGVHTYKYNASAGTTATFINIHLSMDGCCGADCWDEQMAIVDLDFSIPPNQWSEDCIEYLTNLIDENVAIDQELIFEKERADIANQQVCDEVTEEFFVTRQTNEYHYTLYYYDQANNLVQTVPPNGVRPLPLAGNFSNGKYIVNQSTSQFEQPNHIMETRYKYNSINQPVAQWTPDGGYTLFTYNEKGQLLASINADQGVLGSHHVAVQDYTSSSFNAQTTAQVWTTKTWYDAHGRIIETAEQEQDWVFNYGDLGGGSAALMTWDFGSTSGNKREIVSTYYDVASDISGAAFKGDFVRARIGKVTYSEKAPIQTGVYDHAYHYRYDLFGNVVSLLQDDRAIEYFGQRFARTDYYFDQISGKVVNVKYQLGKVDAFEHLYHYDADNRLTKVHTPSFSTLANINLPHLFWIKDATYEYYLHGPLARMELGADRVQGLDYAYTLQGWLKGVNSDVLLPIHDMGKDGYIDPNFTNPNGLVAYDAIGFTLGYYNRNTGSGAVKRDYIAAGEGHTTLPWIPFQQETNGTAYDYNVLYNATHGLYNGNISRMSVALRDPNEQHMEVMGNYYHYDQLNRIVHKGNVLHSMSPAPSYSYPTTPGTHVPYALWNAGSGVVNSEKYREHFTYDANGNILTQRRNGDQLNSNGNYVMENFIYQYGGVSGADLNSFCPSDEGECPAEPSCLEPGCSSDLSCCIPCCSAQSVSDFSFENNRLEQLCETQGDDQLYDNDINQGTRGYQYDQRGNLVQDLGEEIDQIKWTLAGKVKEVIRTASSNKADLEFYYDALGRRIGKVVKPRNGSGIEPKTKWKWLNYRLDAQGNVMSVYEIKYVPSRSEYVMTRTEAHIYGSERIGMYTREVEVSSYSQPPLEDPSQHQPAVFVPAFPGHMSNSGNTVPGAGAIYDPNFGLPNVQTGVAFQKTSPAIQPTTPGGPPPNTVVLGTRLYELKNHLGNVLATITDFRKGLPAAPGGTSVSYYFPNIKHTTDYSAFGAPLPGRTFDSEYVNQQVTTTTQVHSADFESATGVSLCSGPPAQSKWDDWQTTWCTADVLVEREQESGSSNYWLAVNSKYCTNGAMFTFYPTDETHTVTMDVTFGTATSVNVLLFWRCPGGGGSWTSSSFMTNVSGTAGSTSPVSFTFNPATLSPSASGCEVMIMVRKNSCASTVETFYLDNVNISYQSTSTQPVLVKAGYRYGFNGQEKDNEVMGEGNSYTAEFWNYDARLGRRWNVDPKPDASLSNYSVFSNNPVYFMDILGDTITASKEGAEVYMRGFEKTLGRINPFFYDESTSEIRFDKEILQLAREQATCEGLDLINATVYLIEHGQSRIIMVNHGDPLPGSNALQEKTSLELESRGAVTISFISKTGRFIGADIYLARNPKSYTGAESPINPKYDSFGNLIAHDGFIKEEKQLTADDISMNGLHELYHPFLRGTKPSLSQKEHNGLVEDFENRLRQTYQVGSEIKRARVKGYGRIKYTVPTFMGGRGLPHDSND